LSTIGTFFMGISILFLFYNLYITYRKNETVGKDPWDGRTLEWTVDSPVPEETFTPMPIVEDYAPLWQAKSQGKTMQSIDSHRASPIATDIIISFVMTMFLGLFFSFMMYDWFILAGITGGGVSVCFIMRALTDERNDYFGKGGGQR